MKRLLLAVALVTLAGSANVSRTQTLIRSASDASAAWNMQFIDRIVRGCSAGATPQASVIVNPASSGNVAITTCTGGSVTINGAALTSGAPISATYITQTPNATLTNEQALSALATGLMNVTTGTGAVTSTVPGTGILTALGVNVGTAGAPVLNGGALGTPSSGTLTNVTGLPVAGLSNLGAGVGTFLVTPSSANLATAVTGETGSGALVFGTLPNFTTGLSVGTNPAATGEIRLPNNTSITFRNAANNADQVALSVNTSNAVAIGGGLWAFSTVTGALTSIGAYPITTTGAASFATYLTSTNCADSAGAAACGSAAAGHVVIDAGVTTVVVSTTAVTANSQITPTFDSSLGTRLGVTCNATIALPAITARTAGTSFTITVAVAPITNPACFGYTIRN